MTCLPLLRGANILGTIIIVLIIVIAFRAYQSEPEPPEIIPIYYK